MKLWKKIFWMGLLIVGCRANNPPYFVADLNNHVITENTQPGTVVYTLKAVDPEGSLLKFGLMGTDKLAVDENTGDVTVAKPIDRETASFFKLKVTVEDVVASGENNIVTVPVVVTVLDMNDNPPHFVNQSSFESIEVSEETRVGSRILTVSLTDPDMTGFALTLNCTPSQQTPEACEVFPIEIKESTAGHLRAEIRLASKLDYRIRSLYRFTLASTDGEHTTTARVLIRIRDIQNTPPEFTGSMAGRVSEDAAVGSLVMVIQARDGDRGKPRDIKLSLLSNPGDSFQLDSRTGYLITTRPLDREVLGSALTLQVKAQEILRSDEHIATTNPDIDVIQTTANVTVLIDDVNDFAPRFNRKEFYTDVDENTAVGTPLTNLDMEVMDLDTGTFADFSLKIDGPLSEVFDIEPKVARGSALPVIRIKKKFDYENPNERKFLILVIAQNLEEPQLFTTATVFVGVNDLNDNAPHFDKPMYTLTIPESSKPGTRIGSIVAHDPDSKEFGTEGIVYRLFGTKSNKFFVNEKTGDIFITECQPTTSSSSNVTVASCLDYEAQKTFDMLYMASDNNRQTGFIHSIVPLKIVLTDANDERPTFASKFERTVEENSRQFEPAFFVRAMDVDKTSVISYRIMDPVPQHFKIDPNTGEILIKNPILPPGNFSFRVEASDSVYKANTLVSVRVNDINNHAPIFDTEVTEKQVAIPENAPQDEIIAQVLAHDPDLELNGQVRYSISKGSYGYFDIDELTGEISLVKKLDFYTRDKFDLQVTAEDLGAPPLRSSVIIHITVVQVYHKLPKISPRLQRVQVSESAKIGEVVHKMTTEGGTTSNIKFQFVQPVEARNVDNKAVVDLTQFPDWFELHPSGQVKVKGHLERDIVTSLNYSVMLSSEDAEPGQREFGTLILTLFEVNELPPRVEDMEIEIDEELPPGMSILTMDADDPEGGSISTYFVRDGVDYISIDNKTGEIKVAGRLDFEDKPMYNFTIVAVDSGVPQLSSTATIAIHLLNINDNPPVFNQTEYTAEIYEHAPEGYVVTTVFATDIDGDVVTYDIQPGPFSKAFRVDRLGRITVSKEGPLLLDRDILKSDFFIIGIGAKDSVHVGYATVKITLKDLNDIPPTMEHKNYHLTVHAPLTAMQQLLKVNAYGGDLPETDQISYKIISGNEENIFAIDPRSGIIRADRAYATPGDYRLVIEVTDDEDPEIQKKHFDRSGVLIQVLPGNFRRPEFTFPNKVNWTLVTTESDFKEMEEFQNGGYVKHIGQVLAFDHDEGEAGKISFYFKEQGDNLVTETEKFRIETDTGKIAQIAPLDREFMNSYHLLVVAKDGGKPVSGVNQHVLTVQVQDIDDHLPVFMTRSYNFSIKENSGEGSLVGGVEAVDEDEGSNAQIFYFLASDEDNKYKNEDLRVDIKTGKIYTKKMLDRERIEEYHLYIRASPSPIFNKTAMQVTSENAESDDSITFVTIKVLDENDNPVKFVQKQYNAGINAGAEPGREILTLTTKDVDISSEGNVQYNLIASNLILEDFKSGGSVIPSPFRVDENSGRLTISPAAMRQYSGGNHRFLIKVGAKETVAPFYQDSAQVHVWVVEDWQEVVLTVKSPPEEMLKETLIDILSNTTDSLVLINKITPHVNEDLSVNPLWSDVYVTAVDKKTSGVIPVGTFLQALDNGHDRLKNSDCPMELYSAVPAVGSAGSDGEYFFNARDSFDTAFAGLVALVALLCMGVAACLAVCCCLHRYHSSRGSESEKLQGGMKYPLHHPNESMPGTPAMGRHSHPQQNDMIEDLATDNPLWIDHKMKTYEEQELTMQVASDLDTSNNTEDGRSVNGSHVRIAPPPPHRSSSPQFSHAYATLHPHPPPPTVNYDNLNILGQDTLAVHL